MATSIDASGQQITTNIEDIQVGDTVLTRDQNDPYAPLQQKQVTAVSATTVTSLRLLENPGGGWDDRDHPHHR